MNKFMGCQIRERKMMTTHGFSGENDRNPSPMTTHGFSRGIRRKR